MTDLTARQALIDILSEDLVNQGWGKPNKFWFVLGKEGDEYLEYVTSYELEPAHWMMHRAEEGAVRDYVRGLVTCFESWTYPQPLRDRLDLNEISYAYRNLVPPDTHPNRCHVRSTILVTRDGEAMRCERFSETDEATHLSMDEIQPTGGTGDDLVDYMRVMLGILTLTEDPIHALSKLITDNGTSAELMERAVVEGWSTDRLAAEIFKAAPEDIQVQLADAIPPAVREIIDNEREQ